MSLTDLQLYRKAYKIYFRICEDRLTFERFTEQFTIQDIEEIIEYDNLWRSDIMSGIIGGVIPFEHWREREDIIADLKKEFNNQILIKLDEGLIFYTHFCTL